MDTFRTARSGFEEDGFHTGRSGATSARFETARSNFETARSNFETARSAFDTARGFEDPAPYTVDAGLGDMGVGTAVVGELERSLAAQPTAEPAAGHPRGGSGRATETDGGYTVPAAHDAHRAGPSPGHAGGVGGGVGGVGAGFEEFGGSDPAGAAEHEARRSDPPPHRGAPGEVPVAPEAAAGALSSDAVKDVFSLARHNRVADLTALLDRGVPVDIADAHGNTILIVACQNGLKRVAKLALRRGCDIDARNSRGNTALHFCYAYGYGEGLGAYLVSKGADPAARNDAGFLPHEGIG